MSSPSIALIVPVFQEPGIAATLTAFSAQSPDELVVVQDGDDATAKVLRAWEQEYKGDVSVRILQAARGRGTQMNAGAAVSSADVLWFVHADTRLPIGAVDLVRQAINGGALWGRFDVELSGSHRLFRVIAWFMNWRSAFTGIVTGDQAIFVRRDAFRHLGGYAHIPLMEDIDLSRRLKRLARPYRVRTRLCTSSRRWEQNGIVRTVLTMWALRLLFWLGVPSVRLARWYG